MVTAIVEPDEATRRLRTAYHEAGHAVAALALDRDVYSLRVADDPSATVPAGVTLIAMIPWLDIERVESLARRNATPAERRAIETDVLISYAGPVADAKFSGAEQGVVKQQDFRWGEFCFLLLRPRNRAAFQQAMVRRAQQIIFPRWHEVVAVATALVERGELTEPEVLAAIAAANQKEE
jgi:hypothetical protein